jgi:hypothetical protein
MKSFLFALVQSGLTAFYWWIVTTVSFGLFGGSRNPALPPVPESALMMQTYGTIVVAIVVYALLLMGWWRVAKRR